MSDSNLYDQQSETRRMRNDSDYHESAREMCDDSNGLRVKLMLNTAHAHIPELLVLYSSYNG